MKKLFVSAIFVFAFSLAASAQTAQTENCPENYICLTRQEAEKALKNADEIIALRDEIKVVKEERERIKAEVVRLQIDLARATGEKIGSEAQVISQRQIIEILLKYVRAKKIGVINF